MSQRITQKIVSDGLHTYGKVSWVGGQGKQFVLPYEYGKGESGYGFKFLFFAFGKKADVCKKLAEIINTKTDEEIAQLPFVQCDKKIPLSLRGGTGLNCF